MLCEMRLMCCICINSFNCNVQTKLSVQMVLGVTLSYLGVKPGGKDIGFPQFHTHSPQPTFAGISHDTSLFICTVCVPGLYLPSFDWC